MSIGCTKMVTMHTINKQYPGDKRMNPETNQDFVLNEQTKGIKIGVSACLLGNEVRFDGGHKHFKFITKSLSHYADLKPICPEVEAGFSTPRPAMQLRKKKLSIRLVISKNDNKDVTEQMNQYAHQRVTDLHDLDAYIFKKNSPSCGVYRVPVVINEDGYRERNGRGLFSQAFMKRFPLIPVEEEGRLNDAGLCENFLERVFAYKRWKSISDADTNVRGFIEFHAKHKLMLMARGSHYYQELGRMVSGTTKASLCERREAYIHRFMEVMKLTSTPGRQVNVMQHIMGYMKEALSHQDKQELLSLFEAYRQRQLPLITPMTLLRHHLRKHPINYIDKQHYLEPCPEKLAIRSFV